MKKRTMVKAIVSVGIISAVVLCAHSVSDAYAAEAESRMAAPEESIVETIEVTVPETTETEVTVPETTIPEETTEVTEPTEPETTEAATEETTVPSTTVPSTTTPVETAPATTPATQPTKTESTEETTAATVPTEEVVVKVDSSTEGTVATETEATEPVVETTAPAHEHVYVATATVAPTCTSTGFTTYACECGDAYNGDVTEATAHNYVEQIVSATTESEGYTNHVCPDCGDSYKDNYTPVVVETVEVEVEETKASNCCPGEGVEHNHEEDQRGYYTFIYCEGITEPYYEGYYAYFPYGWHH